MTKNIEGSPTEEDIKKAEAMLDEKQRAQSEYREEVVAKAQSLGLDFDSLSKTEIVEEYPYKEACRFFEDHGLKLHESLSTQGAPRHYITRDLTFAYLVKVKNKYGRDVLLGYVRGKSKEGPAYIAEGQPIALEDTFTSYYVDGRWVEEDEGKKLFDRLQAIHDAQGGPYTSLP